MSNQTLAYAIEDRLYLNITDRCTLACRFCPKHNGSWRVHDYDLALLRRPTVADVVHAIGEPRAYTEVVFCGYGEPTLRLEPLLQIAEYVQTHGVPVRVSSSRFSNTTWSLTVCIAMPARASAPNTLRSRSIAWGS